MAETNNVTTNAVGTVTNTVVPDPGGVPVPTQSSGGSFLSENGWSVFWVLLALVVFGVMWRKGHLMRISRFVGETRDELRKCSWPTKEELKGSTVVVLISALILGLFTIGIDFVAREFVRLLM